MYKYNYLKGYVLKSPGESVYSEKSSEKPNRDLMGSHFHAVEIWNEALVVYENHI